MATEPHEQNSTAGLERLAHEMDLDGPEHERDHHLARFSKIRPDFAEPKLNYREPGNPTIVVSLSEWSAMKQIVLLLARRHNGEAYNNWPPEEYTVLRGLYKVLAGDELP